jgi:DNA-binding response OmpR family regulator
MKRAIYLVEDDRDLQQLLTRQLKNSGYDVTSFYNGIFIITLEDFPDIFLIDIELPDINGFEICKWLKNNPLSKHIPVIFLSASSYMRKLAEDAKADGYIEKPFQFSELVEKIQVVSEIM